MSVFSVLVRVPYVRVYIPFFSTILKNKLPPIFSLNVLTERSLIEVQNMTSNATRRASLE